MVFVDQAVSVVDDLPPAVPDKNASDEDAHESADEGHDSNLLLPRVLSFEKPRFLDVLLPHATIVEILWTVRSDGMHVLVERRNTRRKRRHG